jgi:hypothetical protein
MNAVAKIRGKIRGRTARALMTMLLELRAQTSRATSDGQIWHGMRRQVTPQKRAKNPAGTARRGLIHQQLPGS